MRARLAADGHRVALLTGEHSAAERDKIRRGLHPESGEPEHDILVMSDAGAVGINAQRGEWLVQYDTPVTSMTHAQSHGRIHRLGQNGVELIDLVGDHPHEHRARKRLREKYALRERPSPTRPPASTIPGSRVTCPAGRWTARPGRRGCSDGCGSLIPESETDGDAYPQGWRYATLSRRERPGVVGAERQAFETEVRQWHAVRTQNFKRWFGDWEISARAQAIRALHPISALDEQISDAEAETVYRSLEGVTLPEGRHVQIVRGVFGKLKGHRDHDLIYRVIPRLKELIGESVFAYAEPERDPTKHPNIEGYRNYVGKAQIGAKEYYVRFTLRRRRRGLPGDALFERIFRFALDLSSRGGSMDQSFFSRRAPTGHRKTCVRLGSRV